MHYKDLWELIALSKIGVHAHLLEDKFLHVLLSCDTDHDTAQIPNFN